MILVLFGLAVALVAGLWLAQRRFVYHPGHDVPPVGDVLPGWSEVTLGTSDGLALQAWYRAPAADRPVVIVFHGNGGNRAGRSPLGHRLAEAGLGVLLVDYRGYGGNPGRPTERGLALDARAATRFVAAEVPGHPVVLLGGSLGAAVAVELATEQPPAALVLRSPFTSLADAAGASMPLGRLVPGFLLRDTYRSDERIGAVRSPILFIAGADDSIVPPAQTRALHELAGEPKELLVVPGVGHNSLELLAGDEVIEATIRFIEQWTER